MATEPARYSLILYKEQPGIVVQAGKKLTIELADGQSLTVRPKDVLLLHPGPIHNLAELIEPAGDMKTAWELLAGETTTLADLAELAFNAATPAAVWAVWQWVADGLYFVGTPQAITVRTPEQVAEIEFDRTAKAAKEQEWAEFLARLAQGETAKGDGRFLQDVVTLANNQSDRSRVLQALNQRQTPENAHALLLKVGYWDVNVNPYPLRAGLPVSPPTSPLPSLPAEARRNLTHLLALAIDDEGNQDPDDALSWDNGRLWVHIADVAALVTPDSPADYEARARGANLYLPEGTVPMLPPQATAQLGLGLAEISPALSFALELTADSQIENLEVVPSWVRVTRLTYAAVEERLAEPPFRELYQVAQCHQARRIAQGAIEIELPEVRVRVKDGMVEIRPIPNLGSRTLVREAMLLAGEGIGRLALQNNIPIPFTAQDPPGPMEQSASGLAGMFAQRRAMQRSQQSSVPAAHAGLGMGLYVQCTSPLRRYLDLVVHQQLRAWLRGGGLLDGPAVMERVGAADAVSGLVRQVERQANAHWTLVYLEQNPHWKGEGVIVDRRGGREVVLIPALAWETQLHLKRNLSLNTAVSLAVKNINLPHLEAHFRQV
jgi:exoribonuclease-2